MPNTLPNSDMKKLTIGFQSCLNLIMAVLFALPTVAMSETASQDPMVTDQAIQLVKLSTTDLLKIFIIPLGLWFIKGIIVGGIERYHIIRNLYLEIVFNVEWYKEVNTKFPNWKKENIDQNISPARMKRITWNIPLFTKIYDSSQSVIRNVLWGKEISNLHHLYENFSHLDIRMGVLSKEVEKAKQDKIDYIRDLNQEYKEGDVDYINEIYIQTETRSKQVIEDQVGKIDTLLGEICSFESGKACADHQFYSRCFYLIHGSMLAIIIVILAILI